LTIRFQLQAPYLYCTITDNGIGREKAKAYNKIHRKNHQSVGKLNMERRIEIINQMQEKPILLEIKDNNLKNNDHLGTIVHISIPV